MQKFTPITKLSKRRPVLWLGLLVLIALVLLGFWHFHQSRPKPVATVSHTKTKKAEPTIKVPTHSVTTEGQTIQVPNNVPSDAIKNYTLITENEQYKIRELNGAYTITLYAIINNPSQSDSYHQQLHDYKQAALQYLTNHGVDVNKVSITYDPAEAANY